jgi:VanZ family protein
MSAGEPRPEVVLRRAVAWLLVLTILFICYASLYPFEFSLARLRHPAQEGLLSHLGWRKPPRTDLIANLLFYLPFGVLVVYLTPARWRSLRRVAFTTLTGALLSLLIECLQITTRARDPALADLTLNTLSAALGAVLMLSARGLGLRPVMPQLRAHRPDVIALLLVALWLAFHAAPFMPTAHFIWYLPKPSSMLDWHWTPAAITGFFAGWALLGLVLRSLLQPGSFWPMFSIVAGVSLVARVIIRTQELEFNECVGLVLALPLLAAFQLPALRAALWIAPAFVFFMLAPFTFGVPLPALDWTLDLPVAHRTAAGEPGVLEIIFLYLGMTWLACEAGLGLRRAVLVLFVSALLIEMAHVLQPGKAAHIWGPAAVLAGGAVLWIRDKAARAPINT